jgi:hypothetical protein
VVSIGVLALLLVPDFHGQLLEDIRLGTLFLGIKKVKFFLARCFWRF